MSGGADPQARGQHAADRPIAWDGLPDAVRGRLAELAAAALGDVAAADVPKRLRPVVRFAPAKRARVAAGALLASLADSAAFRAAIVEWARHHRPQVLDTRAEDVAGVAAAAVLLGSPDADERVRVAADQAADVGLRAERDAALARIQRLEDELAAMRAELAGERAETEKARAERASELDRLRRRLRERGVELGEARKAVRHAHAELAGAGTTAADEVASLRAQVDRERQRVEAERVRADRAVASAESARSAARDARAADEVRLALLLDTLDGVAAGLRAELALGGNATSEHAYLPGDAVRGVRRVASTPTAVSDPAVLDRLLGLPRAHLIVDGYNVTKQGYPDLTLADQRDRLARQLSALAARTGAETTVVFDGAGVIAVPATTVRGVRVLFSDPGVSADDVIKSLVAAEPSGRAIIVVTSDREIVDAVRAHGAHPVPSGVLLDRICRI